MKIAVYTIAKNEEQFVERWAESCKEADYRLILDTGSTDKTVELAKQCGVHVATQVFNPWRFDAARNHAMSLIPEDIDYCIALDMDEILVPGWRAKMETVSPGTTRPRYKYVWSWNDDGSEGLVYGADKIHSRHGYVWKHPVHEVLKPTEIEVQQWIDGLEINHHPDKTKSRGQYFGLLKLAVEEEPLDDRNQFYLAREYFFHGMNDDAMRHFNEFLLLSKWGAERAAAYRYMARIEPHNAESLLFKAVSEDPMRRESWLALARLYYERNDWRAVRAACEMMFRVSEKPLDYLCDADAWGSQPHDYMAIACYRTGDYKMAFEHGEAALLMNKYDGRLQTNMSFYAKAMNENKD